MVAERVVLHPEPRVRRTPCAERGGRCPFQPTARDAARPGPGTRTQAGASRARLCRGPRRETAFRECLVIQRVSRSRLPLSGGRSTWTTACVGRGLHRTPWRRTVPECPGPRPGRRRATQQARSRRAGPRVWARNREPCPAERRESAWRHPTPPRRCCQTSSDRTPPLRSPGPNQRRSWTESDTQPTTRAALGQGSPTNDGKRAGNHDRFCGEPALGACPG